MTSTSKGGCLHANPVDVGHAEVKRMIPNQTLWPALGQLASSWTDQNPRVPPHGPLRNAKLTRGTRTSAALLDAASELHSPSEPE